MNTRIRMAMRNNNLCIRRTRKVITLSMLLFANSLSFATEVKTQTITALQDEIVWLQAETFVTTATKTREDIKKSGSTVSVITEYDLRSMGARNLMDALKRVPGLGISINNIGLPVIEVRGVKSDFSEKVLFLINGHTINNNLVNGGATWAHDSFLVDDIKQVEIIRGPGSALYGANAFVAVINIITKTTEDIDRASVSLALGSNETKKLNIQSGKKFKQGNFSINASSLDTDGNRRFIESDMWNNSGYADDWNRHFDLGFNANYTNLSFQGKYVKRNTGPYIGFSNALNDESEQSYTEYFLELSYKNSLTNNLSVHSKTYYNNFNSDNFWELHPENFPPGTPAHPDGLLARSPVTAESLGTELQFEYLLNQHKFIFGLMAEHQTVFDAGFFANFNPSVPTADPLPGGYQNIYDTWPWIESEHRDIQAAFIQDIWDIRSNLRLIIGARYDHYSDVGGSFNPRTSLSWELSDNYSLVATYGSAFRAPNFGELHNANNPAALGNPELSPEEVETYELSLNSQISRHLNIRATLFKNNISDLIDFRNIVASNVGKLVVNGLEIELNSRLQDGSILGFNYTYQYAVDQETDQRIADVPMNKAKASYNYRHSQFISSYLGIAYTGVIKRASDDSREEIPDHTTVDIALNLKNTNKDIQINLSIYNVFNKEYVDPARYSPSGYVVSDFPKPGRTFMLEASYKL